MIRRQRVVVETQTSHHAGAVVLDHHVGGGGEAPEHPLACRCSQIEHDAALAPVHGVETGAVVADGTGHAPARIAFRRLHLDDVRAHVA
jgi:hypothetical protein